jgi:hypothetical protein
MKLEFSRQIFEKPSIFMKIRPVAAELFPADGQTDMTKLTVASRNLAAAPKNPKEQKRGTLPVFPALCMPPGL